ncbi:MAG: hypothetical protein E6J42_04205 [Chloroflexi bacterium]|nr:MAG: hypothetical protein E6J42_04205 [Chloroflexota bacterium]
MGRFLMYAVIGALALFVLSAGLLLEHGGGSSVAVADVTLHDLRLRPEVYKGQKVVLPGTLRYSSEVHHYQVVDGEQQTVVISGYDETQLRPLEGKTVEVAGRFDFDTDTGIYIDADTVRVKD